ncbi:YaiO family outer membrane beta-barrel protein [Flavobacterium sp. W22_SRS_FK3]|uniref:YaiO family outer membrane beta-barrel protein n=1 Tax=Flavobacterium sp. W22_SRS_FK3 TaxID=3240275 RepID=UPI003F909EBF
MKNTSYILCLTWFLLLSNHAAVAQKIDVDSLLVQLVSDYRENKDPQEIIQKAKTGLKIAPDYLDYYLLIGQNFERIKQSDSAQFYYKKVILKSDKYPDAYNYLINIAINNKDYNTAIEYIKKGKLLYTENQLYYDTKKLNIYELQGDAGAELELMTELIKKNPKNVSFKDRYILLSHKTEEDRIGLQYANTSFNRDGYGPWNQFMAQYIRTRDWGTLIGNINAMNRKSDSAEDVNGAQFELSSYIFTTKKDYLFFNAAFSNDKVYPKYRFGASYYISFLKKWEANLGMRYTKTDADEFPALVLGMGTYYKSLWFNLSSFLQSDDNKINPAFTFTSRYYLDTRYDYLFAVLGYGTSPDDNNTSGLYSERINLSSYRIGAGISKTIFNNYIAGFQFLYNNQEYAPEKRQNEYEITVSLQYKF